MLPGHAYVGPLMQSIFYFLRLLHECPTVFTHQLAYSISVMLKNFVSASGNQFLFIFFQKDDWCWTANSSNPSWGTSTLLLYGQSCTLAAFINAWVCFWKNERSISHCARLPWAYTLHLLAHAHKDKHRHMCTVWCMVRQWNYTPKSQSLPPDKGSC